MAISFHTTQNKKPALPQILFEDRVIPYNTETKFLGVHINENMKWITHVKSPKFKAEYKPLYDKIINEYNECTCLINVFCMFPHPSEIRRNSVWR